MSYTDYSQAEIKGISGENRMRNILSGFDRNRFIVLNNLLLRKPYVRQGEVPTVQIDHLVISVFGIFCVETKNYSGAIYGREESENWKVYLGNEVHEFQNPLRQNHGHTKTLQSLLELNAYGLGMLNVSYPIIPVIAFSEKATLKVQVTGASVCYYSRVPDEIMNYCVDMCMTPEQMERVAAYISSINIYSPENMQRHINAINALKNGFYTGVYNEFLPAQPVQDQNYQRFRSENPAVLYRKPSTGLSAGAILGIVFLALAAYFLLPILLCYGLCTCNSFSSQYNKPVPAATYTPPSGNTNNNPSVTQGTIQKPVQTAPAKENLPEEKNITKVEGTLYSPKSGAANEIEYICHGSYHGNEPFTDADGVQYDEYIEMLYYDTFWDGVYIDINATSYNKLSFSFTNGHQFSDSTIAKVQVYDRDTDELLYESDKVERRHTKTAEVDITGHSNIRLKFIDESNNYYNIVLKDIILSDLAD